MKFLNLVLFAAAVGLTISACQPQKTNNAEATSDWSLQDTINVSTAQRLVNNFGGRAHHFKRHELLSPDTRCVWFSIKQLRSLVARIDSEKGDGIRFYSAAYDSLRKPDLQKIDSAYLNYATLVMVSTKYDSIAKHHIDYYKTPKGGINGLKSDKGTIIMAVPENTGELCPPPVKCNTIGATLLNQ